MTEASSWNVFEGLSRSPGAVGFYWAQRLESTHSYLAASGSGEPTFLIPVPDAGAPRYVPPISLAGLDVSFGAECRIRETGTEETRGRYIVLQCRAKDAMAKRCFVQMLCPAVQGLGSSPSFADIRALVDTASELFSQTDAAPESVRGLWGELFLLSRANNVQKALACWRVQDTERYDFSDAEVRLEVKTALGTSRIHVFSLEQLRPVDGVQVFVTSLLLQPSAGGLRISDLVERIGEALTPAEYRSLLARVNATLRGALYGEASLAFDEQAALASLRFFAATDIPSVHPTLPPEVTGVRFRVDLTTVAPRQFASGGNGLLSQFSGL